MEGLVDLAAIQAFLTYHHSKESLVVAILADLYDTSTEDAKRVAQELFVVRQLSMCGSSHTFSAMKVAPPVHCKVTAYAPRKERQTGSNSWPMW